MDREPVRHLLEPELQLFQALHARLRLSWLLKHYPKRPVLAVFMFVNGFVTIGLLSLVAMVSHTPFVFPSLGPTAFLLFFTPTAPTSSPRHAVLGHAAGLVCGYLALLVTGLTHALAATQLGVNGPRILAAALAMAATGAAMVLLRVVHAPAGATTLIVALGIITQPSHLLVIEVAVVLLVVVAFGINRFAGLDYPLWERRDVPSR